MWLKFGSQNLGKFAPGWGAWFLVVCCSDCCCCICCLVLHVDGEPTVEDELWVEFLMWWWWMDEAALLSFDFAVALDRDGDELADLLCPPVNVVVVPVDDKQEEVFLWDDKQHSSSGSVSSSASSRLSMLAKYDFLAPSENPTLTWWRQKWLDQSRY